MGMQPLESGQQRGVDIDQPVAPVRAKTVGQQPHESGQADQFGAGRRDGLGQRGIEAVTVGITLVLDDAGRDRRPFGPLQAAGVRHVGHDQNDPGGIILSGAGID